MPTISTKPLEATSEDDDGDDDCVLEKVSSEEVSDEGEGDTDAGGGEG